MGNQLVTICDELSKIDTFNKKEKLLLFKILLSDKELFFESLTTHNPIWKTLFSEYTNSIENHIVTGAEFHLNTHDIIRRYLNMLKLLSISGLNHLLFGKLFDEDGNKQKNSINGIFHFINQEKIDKINLDKKINDFLIKNNPKEFILFTNDDESNLINYIKKIKIQPLKINDFKQKLYLFLKPSEFSVNIMPYDIINLSESDKTNAINKKYDYKLKVFFIFQLITHVDDFQSKVFVAK